MGLALGECRTAAAAAAEAVESVRGELGVLHMSRDRTLQPPSATRSRAAPPPPDARCCGHCWQITAEHFGLLDEPSEEEEDMLDLATLLTPTSRLGCQIVLSKELSGMEVTLPAYSRNYYVDGHVPEPH